MPFVDNLLVSLLIGAIGLGVFLYGKRQERMPHLLVGFLLIVFPYFLTMISTVYVTIIVALVLLLALLIAVQRGL